MKALKLSPIFELAAILIDCTFRKKTILYNHQN